jgi:hypothetical protein
MPYKYPVWYGNYDRETRDNGVFYASVTGILSVLLLAASVAILFFSTEPHSGVVGTVLGISGLVMGWLTIWSIKEAIAAHKRLRERTNGWGTARK